MPIEHEVQQGDCIASIALQYGFFPDTIWNHSANDDLRSRRKSMHVLMPGDVVVVPDLDPGSVTVPVEKKHRFRRKGVPEKLRVQFFDDDDDPIADTTAVVDIDGAVQRLKTDGQGVIDIPIPPGSRNAHITFESADPEIAQRAYDFELGGIDPITEESGVRHRLENLGMLTDDTPMDEALKAFQQRYDLTVTGEVDEATRSKLAELTTE